MPQYRYACGSAPAGAVVGRRDDLAGLAPAFISCAELDPLRDEAVAYAGLLEHFGVRVEILEAEGMLHGFLRMGHVIPDAMDIVDDVATHLSHYVANA